MGFETATQKCNPHVTLATTLEPTLRGLPVKRRREKTRRKDHIGHKDFQDRNVSSIEAHPREAKTLKSPFTRLGGLMQNSSWYDECIPNILWACIVASSLERNQYLEVFRTIIVNARNNFTKRKETFITHNFLADLEPADFDALLAPALARNDLIQALSALTAIDSLPDSAHWRRVLPNIDPKLAWPILMSTVANTFDHQSECATDIRWLKLVYFIICREQMSFPADQHEFIEELRLYPQYGDMHKVRSGIRAAEMAVRMTEFGNISSTESPNVPRPDTELFWVEMKAKTMCLVSESVEAPEPAPGDLRKEIFDVFKALDNHFHSTARTTSVDAKHDGTFGLVLYGLNLLLSATLGCGHGSVEGRLLLRTLMECFVTLHFLKNEDDDALWNQYRRYGSGQAKLAFLKNIREEEVPDFIDLKLLEQLANEDMWMEFQDMDLGHWAKSNLRSIAEKAGVKDVYDSYYDWSSGYVHGHWVCVRDTVFVNCLNPLHRFHRIPAPPKMNMPTILSDGCRLINRMLEDLNSLYPTFKQRLKWHKHRAQGC